MAVTAAWTAAFTWWVSAEQRQSYVVLCAARDLAELARRFEFA